MAYDRQAPTHQTAKLHKKIIICYDNTLLFTIFAPFFPSLTLKARY